MEIYKYTADAVKVTKVIERVNIQLTPEETAILVGIIGGLNGQSGAALVSASITRRGRDFYGLPTPSTSIFSVAEFLHELFSELTKEIE